MCPLLKKAGPVLCSLWTKDMQEGNNSKLQTPAPKPWENSLIHRALVAVSMPPIQSNPVHLTGQMTKMQEDVPK